METELELKKETTNGIKETFIPGPSKSVEEQPVTEKFRVSSFVKTLKFVEERGIEVKPDKILNSQHPIPLSETTIPLDLPVVKDQLTVVVKGALISDPFFLLPPFNVLSAWEFDNNSYATDRFRNFTMLEKTLGYFHQGAAIGNFNENIGPAILGSNYNKSEAQLLVNINFPPVAQPSFIELVVNGNCPDTNLQANISSDWLYPVSLASYDGNYVTVDGTMSLRTNKEPNYKIHKEYIRFWKRGVDSDLAVISNFRIKSSTYLMPGEKLITLYIRNMVRAMAENFISGNQDRAMIRLGRGKLMDTTMPNYNTDMARYSEPVKIKSVEVRFYEAKYVNLLPNDLPFFPLT